MKTSPPRRSAKTNASTAAPRRRGRAAAPATASRTLVTEPRLRYSVSLVTQGKHRFYTLTMPSSVLARTTFVSSRYEDPDGGFQRNLEAKRGIDIAKYIDEGMGTIPSSIVLSAQPDADLRVIGRGKTLDFRDTRKAFLILDGQHRVYGFSLARTDLRVPVVIYNGLSRADETRLFIDINTKQRPVPNALLLDIRKLAQYQNETEALLGDLFDRFNEDPGSPLIGLLSRSESAVGRISRVTFNAAIKPIIRLFVDKTVDDMYVVLEAYFKVWTDGFTSQNIREAIAKSVVFRAVVGLFPTVVSRVQDRHGPNYSVEYFAELLDDEYFRKIKSKSRGNVGNSIADFQTYLSRTLQRNVAL